MGDRCRFDLDAGQERIESGGKRVRGADRSCADKHDAAADLIRAGAVENFLRTDRRDRAARTIETQRQVIADVERARRAADAHSIRFDLRVNAGGARCGAQRKARQKRLARADEQRRITRRAGVIGRDIDQAYGAGLGDRRHRRDELLRHRQRNRHSRAEIRIGKHVAARKQSRRADDRA